MKLTQGTQKQGLCDYNGTLLHNVNYLPFPMCMWSLNFENSLTASCNPNASSHASSVKQCDKVTPHLCKVC